MFNKNIIVTLWCCCLLLVTLPRLCEASEWEYYNSSNNIWDLAVSNNFLWALTPVGIVRWDLNDNSWESITVPQGMLSKDINAIGSNSDKVLAAANGRLLKYDGTSFVDHELNANLPGITWINIIAIDKSGIEWYVTSQGIIKFDGETFRTFSTDDGLPGSFPSSVATAEDGTVWAVTSYYSSTYKPAKESTNGSEQINRITGEPPYGAYVSMFNGDGWETIKTFEPISGGYGIAPTAGPDNELLLFVQTIYDEDGGRILKFDGSTWDTITLENFPNVNVRSMDINPETNQIIFGLEKSNYVPGVISVRLT